MKRGGSLEEHMDVDRIKETLRTALRVSVFVAIFIILLGAFVLIGPGERGVVLRLGAVQDRIMTEGLNFKIPIIESVEKVDVKIQKEQVDATASSRDLQDVRATVALNFHILPDKPNRLWQTIGKDFKGRVIDPAIQEAVKAITARYTAEELVSKRQQVKDDVTAALLSRLTKDFIQVDELSITNFHFSESFSAAVEAKVKAEQEALTAKNKLEQVKYEAEQRITQAKGEAEAIRIQIDAIRAQGGREYVSLKAIEKWDGKLPQVTSGNAPVPFIDVTGKIGKD